MTLHRRIADTMPDELPLTIHLAVIVIVGVLITLVLVFHLLWVLGVLAAALMVPTALALVSRLIRAHHHRGGGGRRV